MAERVALIGGTGFLGSRILDSLLSAPPVVKITALTRGSSSHPFNPRIRVVKIVSYDDQASLVAALREHDIVISAVSGSAYPGIDELLLRACMEAGVKRFMPSEFTLDVCHPAVEAIASGTLLAAKIAFAELLAKLAADGKIEYTTLVTGGLIDWALDHGFGGIGLNQRKLTLFDKGVNSCTACTTVFVAQAVSAIVQMPRAETRNQRIKIAEVQYTGLQLLDALEHATGTQWAVRHISATQALDDGRKALEQGDVRGAYVGHVLKLNFDGNGAADFPEGLSWNSTGDFRVTRKSLGDIVSNALERAQ